MVIWIVTAKELIYKQLEDIWVEAQQYDFISNLLWKKSIMEQVNEEKMSFRKKKEKNILLNGNVMYEMTFF